MLLAGIKLPKDKLNITNIFLKFEQNKKKHFLFQIFKCIAIFTIKVRIQPLCCVNNLVLPQQISSAFPKHTVCSEVF